MRYTRDFRWCYIRINLDTWRDAYQVLFGAYLLGLCLMEWWSPGTASAWLGVDFWHPELWIQQWWKGR